MLSRTAKLILGLLVLLAGPVLGPGGRVQAGFALGLVTAEPDRSRRSLGFEFDLVLNGHGQAPASGSSPAETGSEALCVPEPDHPHQPALPRDPLPGHGGLHTNGASTGAPPSAGPGGGPGLSFLPPLRAQLLGGEVSGFLFLADERFKPPPFASRLFRPPRAD